MFTSSSNTWDGSTKESLSVSGGVKCERSAQMGGREINCGGGGAEGLGGGTSFGIPYG